MVSSITEAICRSVAFESPGHSQRKKTIYEYATEPSVRPIPSNLQSALWNLWAAEVGELCSDIAELDAHVAATSGGSRGATYEDFLTAEALKVWQSIEPVLNPAERKKLERAFFALVPAYDLNGIACVLPTGEIVVGISIPVVLLGLVNLHLYKAQGHLDQILPRLHDGALVDEHLAKATEQLFQELMHIRAIARIATGIASDLKELPADTKIDLRTYDTVLGPTWTAQFYFIVLHEIGHVCLGHTDSSQMRRLADDTVSVSVCLPSHLMELQADEFALGRFRQDRISLGLPLGVLFAFFRFLEDASQLYATSNSADPPMSISLDPSPASTSHPPAERRFAALRAMGLSGDWYGHTWSLLQTRFVPRSENGNAAPK